MLLKRKAVVAALAAAATAGAQAQVSDGVVKIGVLTDMSSLYCRPVGPGLGARRPHGGGGFRRAEAGHEGGDHLRRPPEQGRRRLADRAPVVRRRQGRRDRRHAELGRRAGGEPGHARQGQGVHRLRRGHLRPDRQGVLAEHDPLDLRHLDARQRHRQRGRQDRRRHLVLPDRGLRVRPRARARHRGRGAEDRRQGARQGAASR